MADNELMKKAENTELPDNDLEEASGAGRPYTVRPQCMSCKSTRLKSTYQTYICLDCNYEFSKIGRS